MRIMGIGWYVDMEVEYVHVRCGLEWLYVVSPGGQPIYEVTDVFAAIDNRRSAGDRVFVGTEVQLRRMHCYSAWFEAALDTLDYELNSGLDRPEVFETA